MTLPETPVASRRALSLLLSPPAVSQTPSAPSFFEQLLSPNPLSPADFDVHDISLESWECSSISLTPVSSHRVLPIIQEVAPLGKSRLADIPDIVGVILGKLSQGEKWTLRLTCKQLRASVDERVTTLTLSAQNLTAMEESDANLMGSLSDLLCRFPNLTTLHHTDRFTSSQADCLISALLKMPPCLRCVDLPVTKGTARALAAHPLEAVALQLLTDAPIDPKHLTECLTALAGITSLHTLQAGGASNFDQSCWEQLHKFASRLTHFELDASVRTADSLPDVNACLSALSSLTHLTIQGPLQDISISHLSSLKSLDMTYQMVMNSGLWPEPEDGLSQLSRLTSLTSLSARGALILHRTVLQEVIPQMTSLCRLHLSIPVNDAMFASFSHCPLLSHLTAASIQLTQLNPASTLPALTHLHQNDPASAAVVTSPMQIIAPALSLLEVASATPHLKGFYNHTRLSTFKLTAAGVVHMAQLEGHESLSEAMPDTFPALQTIHVDVMSGSASFGSKLARMMAGLIQVSTLSLTWSQGPVSDHPSSPTHNWLNCQHQAPLERFMRQIPPLAARIDVSNLSLQINTRFASLPWCCQRSVLSTLEEGLKDVLHGEDSGILVRMRVHSWPLFSDLRRAVRKDAGLAERVSVELVDSAVP